MTDLLPAAPGWFTFGLGTIGMRIRQAVDDNTCRAYWLDFQRETVAEEWGAFTRDAVRRFGWKFLPSTVELLDALREWRGGEPLDLEAVRAYDAVIAAGVYTAEGGMTWNYRTIAERVGKAAADAFVAAGGHNAFATTWKESERREKFLAAYRTEVRAEPGLRLPAAPEVKQIEGARDEAPTMTQEQALAAIRKLAGMVAKPRVPERPRMTDEQWEARKRELRAKAEAAGMTTTSTSAATDVSKSLSVAGAESAQEG